jgi:arylsulfatase A
LETRQQDYGPDIWSGAITDFMRQNRERPFFVYYPMVLAHDPYLPPPGHPNADPSADWRPLDRPEHYPDMVAYADELVGRIVDTLEELDLRERTLLLFTADNGALDAIRSPLDGTTIRGGKGEMTDAGTHVPLIANWRGVTAPGTVSQDLVDFSDFYATLADIVGARPGDGIDGVSFLPSLKGEATSPREWAFMFYPGSPRLESPGGHWARTRRFKLYGDGRLFDLESDPLEEQPVGSDADTAASAPERRRLQRVFEQLEVPSTRVPVVRD